MNKTKLLRDVSSPLYVKEQFVGSERFTGTQKDVLSALLEEGRGYTEEQVLEIMNGYLEGMVQ
ncbi:hypothetical protein LOZ80_22130 [Paenibacillus sp. HWE-109]|uniref:hypothetical protein n=1 Tax=Paenibacillus sp. HWE-109 TaxID=1306526 RepID=UPI001EDDA935|nr:hypothetical protein [Paenibacillus sp. HWE-109]UKS24320.1 hypothetical protein LOZ80_22130 [Paenibacillus sp. HWE-109]